MRSCRTGSSTELAAVVAEALALRQQIKDDPVATLQSLAEPLDTHKWIYRIVVGSLGISAILVVIGVFVLEAINRSTNIPDPMVAIGSAAIVALATLLTPPHTRSRG